VMCTGVHVDIQVQCLLFVSNCIKTGIFWQIFIELASIKFHESPAFINLFHVYRQTNGWLDRTLVISVDWDYRHS
jgi:hypothetical protein